VAGQSYRTREAFPSPLRLLLALRYLAPIPSNTLANQHTVSPDIQDGKGSGEFPLVHSQPYRVLTMNYLLILWACTVRLVLCSTADRMQLHLDFHHTPVQTALLQLKGLSSAIMMPKRTLTCPFFARSRLRWSCAPLWWLVSHLSQVCTIS
jgi:hypothetical protein